jgi:NAD(P)-dependent dehydrogenase (short-subunit alcohol dehydrogenase family)
MDDFAGRVVIVTGGGSGIGAALARAFAAERARLVLADVDAAAMTTIAGELERTGTEVLCVPTDVGEREQVEALAAAAARFGGIDVLCNNAGVGIFGDIASATHNDWAYTMRVNFWGVVHGIEAFVPRLLAQGRGGHIVNTASMAGLIGMQWLGVYCASKFAVVGLTEALHRELGPRGIGVSVLCPMIVRTNIDANSDRLRPAAFRDAAPSPVPGGTAPPMAGGVIEAETVAARVLRGIRRGDLYVFTHPEQREILRKRAARQDRMFEPDTW